MAVVTAPIDQYHQLSLWLIEQIRRDTAQARTRAATWEPRPLPKDRSWMK